MDRNFYAKTLHSRALNVTFELYFCRTKTEFKELETIEKYLSLDHFGYLCQFWEVFRTFKEMRNVAFQIAV